MLGFLMSAIRPNKAARLEEEAEIRQAKDRLFRATVHALAA